MGKIDLYRFGRLLLPAVTFAISASAHAQSFDPSAADQHLLELVNRIRMNPAAELAMLTNSPDPDVRSSLSFFHVDLQLLAQQWATLVPVPPLAWNESLFAAAVGHSETMLEFDLQSHQLPGEPDLPTRVTNAGYTSFSAVGESIFAFAQNVFHAHAAWAIDWGSGTNTVGGIQNPPGHRENLMNDNFREFGDGLISTNGTSGKTTGPLLITQDFGNRFTLGNPFLLGVVFQDLDSDGFYSEGEGLGGVTVGIDGTGGTFNTTTMTAGGYQLQIPDGMYTVTFSGGTLASPVVEQVDINTDNVKLDVKLGPLPSTDLAITKTDDPDPVIVDSSLTYTILVTNLGTSTAANVTVTDALPASVTFVSASAGCTNIGGNVICDFGSIASGDSVTKTIVVSPATIGIITNTAAVSSTTDDPDLANNTARAVTTVTLLQSDLGVSKSDSPDPVTVGSNLTYTVTVTNKGPATATDVLLTDTLPASVSFVAASPGCTNIGGVVTCGLGDLGNGSSTSIQIVVTANTAGSITNTVSVAAAEADPVSANNAAQAVTTVNAAGQPGGNLTGTLSKVKEKCKTKKEVTVCKLTGLLTVVNNGVTVATPVHLRFFLSTDAAFDAGTDTPLGEVTSKTIKAGKSAKLKLKTTLQASASGRFVLAVDDSNNVLASAPVP